MIARFFLCLLMCAFSLNISAQTDSEFNRLRPKNTSFSSITSLSQLTGHGTAFCKYYDTRSYIEFHRLDNVMWSGSVVNGFIHGKGIGFVTINEDYGLYCCFEGTFSYGMPVEYFVMTANSNPAIQDRRWAVRPIPQQKVKPMTLLEAWSNNVNGDPKFREAILLREEQERQTINYNSTVVDENRSTSPSGDLIDLGSFLGSDSDYCYEKGGRIYNKDGDALLTYNIVFDSNKNFKYYEVSRVFHDSLRSLGVETFIKPFKTYKAIIQTIENAF